MQRSNLSRLTSLILILLTPLSAANRAEQPLSPSKLAQQAAEQGLEPYASLLRQGLPLPPSQSEVNSLPPAEFTTQSTAIKRVLLQLMAQARDEHHRITPENYATCAQLAAKENAPAVLKEWFNLHASGQLSGRDIYAISEGLNTLCSIYRVDEGSIRYLVEYSHLPADTLCSSFDWLPVKALFNRIPEQELDFRQIEADYTELSRIAGSAANIYRNIHTREQADAAIQELIPLLERREATALTRCNIKKEDFDRIKSQYGLMLTPLFENLRNQRKRVEEENYYDSARLRILDLLFE